MPRVPDGLARPGGPLSPCFNDASVEGILKIKGGAICSRNQRVETAGGERVPLRDIKGSDGLVIQCGYQMSRGVSAETVEQVVLETKYAGYIDRQSAAIERLPALGVQGDSAPL